MKWPLSSKKIIWALLNMYNVIAKSFLPGKTRNFHWNTSFCTECVFFFIRTWTNSKNIIIFSMLKISFMKAAGAGLAILKRGVLTLDKRGGGSNYMSPSKCTDRPKKGGPSPGTPAPWIRHWAGTVYSSIHIFIVSSIDNIRLLLILSQNIPQRFFIVRLHAVLLPYITYLQY